MDQVSQSIIMSKNTKKPAAPAVHVSKKESVNKAHSKSQIALPKRYKWIFANNKSMMRAVCISHADCIRHPPAVLREHT